jgi:hypothetical protein
MRDTADCRKGFVFGIYFYTYGDKYYSSFCTRTVTGGTNPLFQFWYRDWYKNWNNNDTISIKVNSDDDTFSTICCTFHISRSYNSTDRSIVFQTEYLESVSCRYDGDNFLLVPCSCPIYLSLSLPEIVWMGSYHDPFKFSSSSFSDVSLFLDE